MSKRDDSQAGGGATVPPSAGDETDGKKSGAADPPLPDGWDRCHAYNRKKSRYCRQMPLPPSAQCFANQPRYCGNHRHLLEEWLSNNEHMMCAPGDGGSAAKRQRTDPQPEVKPSNRSQKERGKRVPCPVDPSHFIFESAIEKHVLVCPAAVQKREVEGKAYYSEGINLGGFGELGTVGADDDMCDLEEAKKLALEILRVFRGVFLAPGGNAFNAGSTQSKSEQLQSITEQEIYDALPEVDLSTTEEGMEAAMCSVDAKGGKLTDAIARHKVKAGGPRHLQQIASILGHVRQNELIPASACEAGSKPLVIEMGAGRGMTGLVVAGATAVSAGRVMLCLVEKAGTRRKAETKARIAAYRGDHAKEECLRLDLVGIDRVKCDLAHVDMSKALHPSNSAKRVVVAKHLCGAGTDLALKSLRNLDAIDGCVMATCCHGLCTWTEYVGRDCFQRLFGSCFGEREFNLMKRWAPASVLNDSSKYARRNSDEEVQEEHSDRIAEDLKGRYPSIAAVVNEAGLSCGVRGLGRACQRLIDYGRCEYMQNQLFGASSEAGECMAVKMLHYVSRDVTPQNALLVASKHC
ncbi:hypothetical protein ACHAXT_007403 [Thalassiosira profunda]